MRKIFFLLVAFVCSLSLSAAVPAQKVQMTKAGLVAAPTFTKSDEMQKNRAQKIADHKKAIEVAKAQKTARAPKKVALTDADTVVVTINEIALENYGSNDYPNFLFMLYGVDANGSDDYYVALDCYPTINEYVGINVNTEYDENYTQTLGSYFYSAVNNLTTQEGFWLNDPIEDDPTSISTFYADTISAGLWKVDGNFVCENGVVYVVKGENIVFNHPTKMIVQPTQVQSEDYGTDVWFQFFEEVDGGVNAFTLDVLVDGALESGKTYSYNDDVQEIDLGYSYAYFSKTKEALMITEADFTPTLDEQGNLTSADFLLKTDLGDEISGHYEKPAVPQSYTDVNLTANLVDVYDFTATDGIFQIFGVSEDGQWNLSVAAEGQTLIGEHPNVLADFCYIGLNNLTIDFVKNVVEIKNVKVVDAGQSTRPTITGPQYICTADFYCYDGNCYHLTLNRIAPDVASQHNFKGYNMKQTVDEMTGMQVFYSHDSKYEIAIGISGLDAQGYATGDVQASVYNLNEDEESEVYSIAGVQIVESEDKKTTKLYAMILLKNGELVNIIMNSTPLDPTAEDIILDVNPATSQLRRTEIGFFVELNSNNNEKLYLDFSRELNSVLGHETDLTEAIFETTYFTPEASSYYGLQYTVDAGTLQLDRIGEDSLGYDLFRVQVIALVSALIEDEEREEKESDGKYYYYDDVKWVRVDTTIRFKAGLELDEEVENIEAAYTLEEVSITPNLEEGWFLLQGKSADGLVMAVVFLNDHEDADITIPAGEYTFASTMENNTCFASPGLDAAGSPQASYLAKPNPILTFLIDKIWFLTAGTAQVAKDENNKLMILIEATNSNKRTVTINVNDYHIVTALDNVNKDIKVIKRIENNRLIIERYGRKYDVLGR